MQLAQVNHLQINEIRHTLMLALSVGPVQKELMQKLSYVLCQQSLFGIDQPITKLLTT